MNPTITFRYARPGVSICELCLSYVNSHDIIFCITLAKVFIQVAG